MQIHIFVLHYCCVTCDRSVLQPLRVAAQSSKVKLGAAKSIQRNSRTEQSCVSSTDRAANKENRCSTHQVTLRLGALTAFAAEDSLV